MKDTIMSSQKTAVIVEDDFLIAGYLKDLCEDFGIKVLGLASDAEAAWRTISDTKPMFVLMDVRLGGKRDGVDVAMSVAETLPETKTIFITGSNEPPTIQRINNDHPYRILIKPIVPGDLHRAFFQ